MDPKQFRQIIREEVTSIVKTEVVPIKEVLGEHSKKFDRIEKVQQEHTKQLTSHTEQLEAITAELHVVHKLADLMLWEATGNSRLEAFEVCLPPYQDGRYENLNQS